MGWFIEPPHLGGGGSIAADSNRITASRIPDTDRLSPGASIPDMRNPHSNVQAPRFQIQPGRLL